MNKFLAQFFPSIRRQALPFKPLATINVSIEAPRVVSPFLRARPALQTTVTDCSGHHTNQLSS